MTLAVSGPVSSPEYLPLRVAEAEGYFTREGLTVTLRTTRAEVGAAEALAQGQAELAATSLEAVLRFGPRLEKQQARVVFGLTAAPPVAIMAASSPDRTIQSLGDLIGLRIGVAAPGVPEHTWFNALMTRARLRMTQVDLVSLGTRGLVTALEVGDVHGGLVPEPYASRLLAEGHARVLVDLRTPESVRQAFGGATLNAAVFTRADRRPSDSDLTAFVRALLAAERHIATASAEALAERLPRPVVGTSEDFERRLEATRRVLLKDGWVTAEQLRESIAIIRAHLALPPTLKLGSPEGMLLRGPLRRAIDSPPR